jgi:HAD superfamily hydrolase (TIGR01509 family)
MNNFSAIIFDMDGVIVDSEPLHAEVEQMVCQHFQLAVPLSTWDGSFTRGRTEKDFFEFVADTYGPGRVTAEQLIAYKKPIYIQLAMQKLQLFPGILSFLEKARATFAHMALTTSTIASLQQKMFEKFNLGSFFDVVVTGDQISKGKPDPEPYLLTAQKLNLPTDQCLVLEDAINGVVSAKKAGCLVVGITNSFTEKELYEAGADKVVDTYEQLAAYLQELGN